MMKKSSNSKTEEPDGEAFAAKPKLKRTPPKEEP